MGGEGSIQARVILAQAGDGDAFRWLMKHYERRLTSWVRKRIGRALASKTDIQDILQEVWMKAHASIGRFERRGRNSFFRWLKGIADHVIKDKVRYHLETPRGREHSLDDYPPDAACAANDRRIDRELPTPSQELRRKERFERLARAFHRLSPTHREVLLLARIKGLPICEVAVEMQRTPAAVSSLLLRAVRELRREFGSASTESFGLGNGSLDGPQNGLDMGAGGGPVAEPPPPTSGEDRETREPGRDGEEGGETAARR